MPEQITKYPDVTLEVLKSAGAACGTGAPQKILKQCPADRFCALPGGEMCVYGMNEIPKMTQITVEEMAQVVCPKPVAGMPGNSAVSPVEAFAVGAVFVAGIGLGRFGRRNRDRPPSG